MLVADNFKMRPPAHTPVLSHCLLPSSMAYIKSLKMKPHLCCSHIPCWALHSNCLELHLTERSPFSRILQRSKQRLKAWSYRTVLTQNLMTINSLYGTPICRYRHHNEGGRGGGWPHGIQIFLASFGSSHLMRL